MTHGLASAGVSKGYHTTTFPIRQFQDTGNYNWVSTAVAFIVLRHVAQQCQGEELKDRSVQPAAGQCTLSRDLTQESRESKWKLFVRSTSRIPGQYQKQQP